jgi:threonine aldolase
MIDLRSDTVTKPTPQMKQAMMDAEVGDDVYGEDPTVNALQTYAANLFGKEAALFCASGTMTNQIAIHLHTRKGDELLCAEQAHVYKYEGGGAAFHSGVQVKQLQAERGLIQASQIVSAINADDVHFPSTKLVCLENTSNRGGGSVYTLELMQDIATVCKQHNLALHLDGARIFNAMLAGGYSAKQVGEVFDSLSVCLSKGLGAPVGSLLLGSQTFIKQAKRIRKLFGGGMRQAGFLAAAGMYALEHHVTRLTEDHQKAKRIERLLHQHAAIRNVMPVQTNIVIAQLENEQVTDAFIQNLNLAGIKCGRIAPDSIRMVLHLDVSEADMDNIEQVLKH